MPADASNAIHFPKRCHFAAAAALFWAIALYGSLVPFHFAPLGLGDAAEQFAQILAGGAIFRSRSDFLANVLLFVPIGFFWLATLSMDRAGRPWRFVSIAVVLASCLASSFFIEFLQTWFPGRVPSRGDIVAQSLGALVGIALWLGIGRSTVEWIRTFSRFERPADKIDWLLRAYFVGLVIYSVVPFELTLSPADLVQKFRDQKIVLVPFVSADYDLEYLLALASNVAVFIPVGMLAAVTLTSQRRPVRSFTSGLCLGTLAAVGIEVMQLLVIDRYCTTGDVLTGCAGVAIGVLAMRHWRGTIGSAGSEQPAVALSRRNVVLLAAAASYCIVLVLVFCAPLDWISDSDVIRSRYQEMMRTPFAVLQQGHPLNAATQVIRKGVFFAPLGGMLALVVSSLPVPVALRRFGYAVALAATAGVALVIELLPVFLPPHVPDLSDVLLCAFGSLLGMIAAVYVFARL